MESKKGNVSTIDGVSHSDAKKEKNIYNSDTTSFKVSTYFSNSRCQFTSHRAGLLNSDI